MIFKIQRTTWNNVSNKWRNYIMMAKKSQILPLHKIIYFSKYFFILCIPVCNIECFLRYDDCKLSVTITALLTARQVVEYLFTVNSNSNMLYFHGVRCVKSNAQKLTVHYYEGFYADCRKCEIHESVFKSMYLG